MQEPWSQKDLRFSLRSSPGGLLGDGEGKAATARREWIGRLVLKGEGSDLLRLLPGTLEALLACYFEPGEPQGLARAALVARN